MSQAENSQEMLTYRYQSLFNAQNFQLALSSSRRRNRRDNSNFSHHICEIKAKQWNTAELQVLLILVSSGMWFSAQKVLPVLLPSWISLFNKHITSAKALPLLYNYSYYTNNNNRSVSTIPIIRGVSFWDNTRSGINTVRAYFLKVRGDWDR